MSMPKKSRRNSNKKHSSLLRKRLSVAAVKGQSSLLLDGTSTSKNRNSKNMDFEQIKSPLFNNYGTQTRVGVVPFNPSKVNQDRTLILPNVPYKDGNIAKDAAFFGVFDGHGMYGHDCSSYIVQQITEYFTNKNPAWNKSLNKSLVESCISANKQLNGSAIDSAFSGSTGVFSIITDTHIFTANVGDSRSILAREEKGKLIAIPLSFDQKPENPKERIRIEKSNGRIEPCKGPMGEYIGPHRVWLRNQQMPGLAMSRSFGDDVAEAVGVIAKPEIIQKLRHKRNDKFLVVASDGVWEFLSNEEVISIVNKFKDAKKACHAIVKESTKRWQEEEDVIDDITVVIVYF